MKSLTTPEFWQMYAGLPPNVRAAARKAYKLWQQNPRHGPLQFQKRGRFWRINIGLGYRALALPVTEGYLWFWIGPHDEYERILAGK